MSDYLQDRVREARRDRGLTQAQLAHRSGTSRVTVARFESGGGGNIRMGSLTALCRALDLEIDVCPRDARRRLESRLARERERSQRLERRLRHARLAARLLAMPRREALSIVARASGAVDRWQRERLCSHHYVTRWRRLLAGSPADVAARLLDPGDWGDALFQNTPFSPALELPEA